MKKICILCNKKISSFDINAMPIGNNAICSNCLHKFNADLKTPSADVNYAFNKRVYNEIKNDISYKLTSTENKEAFERKFKSILSESKKKFGDQAYDEEDEETIAYQKLEEESKNQILTTAPSISGYEIESYIDIITAECTLGTGIASSVTSTLVDMIGAESDSYSSKVHEAISTALERLRIQSLKLGGDGVIGLNTEIEVFSRDIILAICTGTCVKLKKIVK